MPLYDYECENCGEMELEHRMTERPNGCPKCGSDLQRIYSPTAIKMDCDWRSENGGKGRYISQMAEKQGDPNAYFRSRKDVHKACSKKGWKAHNL
jgi:putative FmdB family regulatory protein